MTLRAATWLLPVAIAAHHVEEAIWLPRYVPGVLARLPASVQHVVGPLSVQDVRLALGLATAIPLGVSLWAAAAPGSRAAVWLLVAFWAALLLNVAWHVAAALVVLPGYAPGVATAVVVNLPLSALVLRQALRDDWVSRAGRRALLPAAVVLHLAGTVGLLLLGRSVAGAG
jgi:hypothetical protein